MTVQNVNTASPRAPDPSQRPGSAVPAGKAGAGAAFSKALETSRQELTETTVRPGDTLVGIVQRHLKASGSPARLNGDQTFRLALGVASDNGLSNPNLILPGQVLDLSSLESRAIAEAARPAGASSQMAQARLPAASTLASTSSAASGSAATASPGAAPSGPLAAQTAGSRPAANGAMAVPAAFLIRHGEAAQRAQAASGIPASFMLSQAALETGWGRQEIRMPDGSTSFNLFGMRAGPGWEGKTAEVWTTEFVNGAAQRVRGRFRAYDSYEESFADYARLISQNPRYAAAMRHVQDPAAFSAALQNAGYATAPDYGATLASVIQTTLRVQGALGDSLVARRATPGVQLVSQTSAAPGAPSVPQAVMPGAAQVLGMRAGSTGAAPAATPAAPAATPAGVVRPPRLRPYAMLETPPIP